MRFKTIAIFTILYILQITSNSWADTIEDNSQPSITLEEMIVSQDDKDKFKYIEDKIKYLHESGDYSKETIDELMAVASTIEEEEKRNESFSNIEELNNRTKEMRQMKKTLEKVHMEKESDKSQKWTSIEKLLGVIIVLGILLILLTVVIIKNT